MTDPIDAATAEIAALRKRLADLDRLARQAQPPPDKPAGFDDAIRAMARDGTAAGPGIDSLRRQILERPPAADPPDGSAAIDAAYQAMKATAALRNAIETASPGASGLVDVLHPTTARAADKLDRILKGRS